MPLYYLEVKKYRAINDTGGTIFMYDENEVEDEELEKEEEKPENETSSAEESEEEENEEIQED